MLSDSQFNQLRRKFEKLYGVKVSNRRVKSIEVNSSYHWQPPLSIVVDQKCANLWKDSPAEEIVAILESKSYLVCTPEHGCETGAPYIFTRSDVRSATYEDDAK